MKKDRYSFRTEWEKPGKGKEREDGRQKSEDGRRETGEKTAPEERNIYRQGEM